MPTDPCLIGRGRELSQLRQALTEESAPAAVLSGAPGIGKTALIDQLCAHATAHDWRVVRALGVQVEQPFALGGLNQIALGLREFRAGLDESDRAVLAPVFGADPTTGVSVLPLAAALLNLLTVAAATQPVLLAVDDVHWLDSVSAEVLSAVGRRLTGSRVRIVAGLRTPYEAVFSTAGWDELSVAPLDVQDSERLLERTGAPLTAALTTTILAAAAGNPLALLELPRSAHEIEYGAETIPLTERLLAVFGGRLEQLDASVRAQLLRAALDGLADSAQPTTRNRYVTHTVETAIEAGLLVVNPLGKIVFRHPLVPAVVVHRASPQDLVDAHRDLAGLYADVLVRRAVHLAAAATGPDQEVSALLVRAARLSIRQGGLSVAVGWLRRAAELSTEPKRRTELSAEAVFVAVRAGRFADARKLLEGTEHRERQSPLAVLADAYEAFHGDGEVDLTHRLLLDALADADTLDDGTLNRLANLLLSVSNFADDAEKRARTNAALLPMQDRLNPAILMHGNDFDDIVETTTAIRKQLAGYVEALPRLHPAMVLLMLSFPAYCTDAMADFRAPLKDAFTKLSERGASLDAIEGGRVVMLDLIATGHWEKAQQIGATCLEMASHVHGSELMRHTFLADLGLLAADRGDVQTARRYATEATAWSTPRGLNMLLRATQRIAVRVALAEADYETAYQAVIKISPPGQFPRHNIQVGDDMLDLIEAAINTGHLNEARDHATESVRQNFADISPRVAALTTAITAMTAPDSQAGALYESAISHPGIAEFPFEHARIHLAHGMWLRRGKRHTEARAALSRAVEEFDQLGAKPWADRARAELRAAGASAKQTRGEAAILSPQERRVAELAASGETSKAIAAQLSLSPRTVDTHLYNALRKLGISRRAALANALRDHATAAGAQPEGTPTL